MYIDPTAEVSQNASLGEGVTIWGNSIVRENTILGSFSSLGRSVYVGPGCRIGSNCKIQNQVQVYEPCLIGNGVFIGPGVILTNDKNPRAMTTDNQLKSELDWVKSQIVIEDFATLGAGVICIAPITIGSFAFIAAGAVVTHSVPNFALMIGVPAKQVGWVGPAGVALEHLGLKRFRCPITGAFYREDSGQLLVD
jgi:UDP-2-acetamido-3-amino-2,3-dideoxy-glucuronate N-acetyltransferase